MAKKGFELNSAGVRELLKSEAMQNLLKSKADAAVNACGPGYDSDIYVGKNRANAAVFASTFLARRDNMKNNTILKAVR